MNKQTFSTPTLSALKVIILALVLGLGISYAQAVWQGPTEPPTGNNVDAPINVGPSYQTKLGSVSINTTTSNPDPYGLDVFGISRFFGKVGIGTASPAVALDVVGEARSSTSTIASSNAKTLVTKDYVDTKGAFGSYTTLQTLTHTYPNTIVVNSNIFLITKDSFLLVRSVTTDSVTSYVIHNIFVDTFTPPTTLRASGAVDYPNGTSSTTYPIPKNSYVKVISYGGALNEKTIITVLPIGF